MAAMAALMENGLTEHIYLAENAKKCGNDKFKGGNFADAIDWYDTGLKSVDGLMQQVSELQRHAAQGKIQLNKAMRKDMKKTKLLHAHLNCNRCKALCKVGRWGEARMAAATVREVSPEYDGAIKAGAHAALGEGDAGAKEWDSLRNYALKHPEDDEAQDLVASWEALSGGVSPALATLGR